MMIYLVKTEAVRKEYLMAEREGNFTEKFVDCNDNFTVRAKSKNRTIWKVGKENE